MPRRVQDIIPNKHRSIRDIPIERNNIAAPIEAPIEKELPKSRARTLDMKPVAAEKRPIKESAPISDMKMRRIEEDQEEISHSSPKLASVTPPHTPPHTRSPKKRRSAGKWILIFMGIVILIAGMAYVTSVYFSQATFSISPVRIPVAVNANYVAQSTAGKDALVYELAVVRGSATTTVAATNGPQTSTPAKGSVTLYNEYSKESQQLIAGTRLADDSGKIYRLNSSVVIPGYTSSGSTITPGTITTAVTADKPGPSYNITKSETDDLTIVAYKGTARYSTMYARLATDISGGFTGTKKVVNPDDLAAITASLKKQVSDSLLNQVRSTVPEGYVMHDDGYVASFSEPVVDGGDAKSAMVTIQGTLYGILFKEADLVSRIAGEQKISEFGEFEHHAEGIQTLEFSIANAKDFSPEKKNTLIIKLKGDIELVGSIPENELKSKLAGLQLSETVSVLRQYKPVIKIEESSAQVIPPWSKVPTDSGRISIEVLTK